MDKLIHNLYSAYNQLNEQLFNNGLPNVIITVQSRPDKKCTKTYGWVSQDPIWCYKDNNGKEIYKYELNIVAEHLDRPFKETICTLIHEMVHISCSIKRLDDCSTRQNHKMPFKEECDRINLLCEKVPRHGWAKTTLSPHLIEVVNNLKVDKEVFKIHRITKPKEKRTRNVTPKFKYKCPGCNHEITSKTKGLHILCKDCNIEYRQENK